MKLQALIWDCAQGNEEEHMRRDNCWNCAPFWRFVPLCPYPRNGQPCRAKLKSSGYCKKCKKYADRGKKE